MSAFDISIHALLAESDLYWEVFKMLLRISIHALLAESDMCHRVDKVTAYISIHALLAESDAVQVVIVIMHALFLSTLSLRRATFVFCS